MLSSYFFSLLSYGCNCRYALWYLKNGKLKAKLVEAPEDYGYNYDAHDSIEDVRATQVVFENLIYKNLS